MFRFAVGQPLQRSCSHCHCPVPFVRLLFFVAFDLVCQQITSKRAQKCNHLWRSKAGEGKIAGRVRVSF